MDRIAQHCEYLLVQTAEEDAELTNWTLTTRAGRQCRARLVVDEWTDCPVIEATDPESGDVLQRFGVRVNCWPIR
jgi:hypothetical protein